MIHRACLIFFSVILLQACASKAPDQPKQGSADKAETEKKVEEKSEPKNTTSDAALKKKKTTADKPELTQEQTSESAKNLVEEEKVEEKKESFDKNSPKDVIRKYTSELQGMVDPEEEENARNLNQEAKIVKKVRRFFDFPGLARMSLGHHWSKISRKQQKEFSNLFIELIEDSYLRRSRSVMGDYDIEYRKEEIRGKRAKVVSTVARSDADVDIVYELHRIDGNWMIFNIILDNVDLIRNYQSQFNSIIAKSSFDGLLEKMKKKKQEIENGDKNNI